MCAAVATTRINNKHVKAIPIDESKKDKRQAKGWQVIPECYANIALIAKKKSGKTSVIFQLIKECAGRDTNIIAFVSTLLKDEGWMHIKEYCENRGISFVGYTSLKEDGVDQLAELVKHLQEEEKKDDEPDSKEPARGQPLPACSLLFGPATAVVPTSRNPCQTA